MPFQAVALGDSITAASAIFYEGPDSISNPSSKGIKFDPFSWASGAHELITLPDGMKAQVQGHFARLTRQFGSGRFKNLAQGTGSTILADIVNQATEASALKPDYATILMGANDLCSANGPIAPNAISTAVGLLVTEMNRALDLLIQSNREIRILLVSIPNMRRVYEIGTNPNEPQAASATPLAASSCQERWNVLNTCSPLLESQRTETERANFYAALNAINQSLESLSSHPNFRSNLRFIKEIAITSFESRHISRLDCYHPSTDGQNLLSEITWQRGWFGSNP